MSRILALPLTIGPGLTQFEFTPANESAVRVISFVVSYTADSTGTGRDVGLYLTNANNQVVYETGAAGSQPASTTRDYVGTSVIGSNSSTVGPVNTGLGFPWPDFWMPAGWMINGICLTPGVADHWGSGTFLGEFASPPPEWERPGRVLSLAAR